MKEFIFYTTEGYTTAPDGHSNVENCQILGITSGCDSKNALHRLLQDSPWIVDLEYNIDNIICRELTLKRDVQLSI